jgi:hypothetical protein
MHSEAFAFVKQFSTNNPISVIDIGSRDINGTCRPHFPNARYFGLDLYAGPSVDWVGTALDYKPPECVDCILCCEVFEHTNEWRDIIARSAAWLTHGGSMIITCAGYGRLPHSHHDGCQLRPNEYYCNVSPEEIREAMSESGLRVIISTTLGNDTQAMGINI